jgi:hypothetical protein
LPVRLSAVVEKSRSRSSLASGSFWRAAQRSVQYFTICWTAGSGVRSFVTAWFVAVVAERITSPVSGSRFRLTSPRTRPWLDASRTGRGTPFGSGIMQLNAVCQWPPKITSMSGDIARAASKIGPVGFRQSLNWPPC